MKTVDFEYGEGVMSARLPDSADIFVPGETVADPPFLLDPIAATKEAILNPIGMDPISKLVKKGSKVVIIFPDRVKGGYQETSHRKVAIPIAIEECLKAGVEKKDIRLICSNGLHRKNTKNEIKDILGDKVFNDFWWTNQIVNHDSEDKENLVDLGYDEMGSKVIMNKEVFEADLAIQVGHVMGNPYGGYSGGYKHCSTGITNWECISSHHVPDCMHRADFIPVNHKSQMRQKFDSIGMHMEKYMKNRYFTIDAVLDTKSRQIAVYAGYCKELQPISFEEANKRTYIPWAEKKYDVIMFGMPQNFHYGNGHGTNPILMLQAISANIIRHKRILSDNCVVIVSSICNGYFNDAEFPSYRAVYELYQKDYNNELPDLNKYGEYFAKNQDYIDKYRFGYGYHPFHAFSMISCGHIAHMHTSQIYIVGAYEPGYARGMGMKPMATFEAALKDAKKYVGDSPNILALPRTFKTVGVHLMMKGDSI